MADLLAARESINLYSLSDLVIRMDASRNVAIDRTGPIPCISALFTAVQPIFGADRGHAENNGVIMKYYDPSYSDAAMHPRTSYV